MIPAKDSKAPDFSLPDETGRIHELSQYLGKPVILYFYPKDDTPGCTVEACSFRDNYHAFKKAGAVVLGVSPDTVRSHAKFKEKHNLSFPLLADEKHAVCEMYGVWGRKKFLGKEYDGVFRTTFVIDPDGRIKKVFENVKPTEHAKEVLEAIQ
jgi:peroxiredoxin Q/BCP